MLGVGLGVNAVQQRYSLVDDPDGLPPGAIAFADFKNGTYHYGGNTLSDFLTENTDWGTFNPTTDIIPGVGLVGAPCLSPGLFAASWASGIRITATVAAPDGLGELFQIEAFDDPDYNEELFVKFLPDNVGTVTLQVRALENGVNSPTAYPGGTYNLDITFSASCSVSATVDTDAPLMASSVGDAAAVNTIGIGCTPNIVCETMAVYVG